MIDACRRLAPLRGGMVKPLRLLICGVPNVGKSTLINKPDRGAARPPPATNPAFTQTEQQIALASDVTLFDTPGMLWPRIAAEAKWHGTWRPSAAIGRNAYDEEEVALGAAGTPARFATATALCERYRIDDIDRLDRRCEPAERNRPAPRRLCAPAAVVHLQKAAEAVINDFRSGGLRPGSRWKHPRQVETLAG